MEIRESENMNKLEIRAEMEVYRGGGKDANCNYGYEDPTNKAESFLAEKKEMNSQWDFGSALGKKRGRENMRRRNVPTSPSRNNMQYSLPYSGTASSRQQYVPLHHQYLSSGHLAVNNNAYPPQEQAAYCYYGGFNNRISNTAYPSSPGLKEVVTSFFPSPVLAQSQPQKNKEKSAWKMRLALICIAMLGIMFITLWRYFPQEGDSGNAAPGLIKNPLTSATTEGEQMVEDVFKLEGRTTPEPDFQGATVMEEEFLEVARKVFVNFSFDDESETTLETIGF